ncbi:MAG: hypothetical protein QM804_06870 [Propionicimonas sp.]
MKTTVSVAKHLPYHGYQPDYREFGPRWDDTAERRRWLSRVEGLAGSRIRRLLGELVDPAGLQEVSFRVEFDPDQRLWRARKNSVGRVLNVELYPPEAVTELLSIDQAATYVQGFAGSVVAERLGVEPRMQVVEGGSFPLVSVLSVPRCGSAHAWHRDPDVDAFAKTVSVVNGIWRRSGQWGKVRAGWPVLELVPRKRAGAPGCLPGCGRVAVGVRGFAQLPDREKAQVVLDGLRAGIVGQWGGIRPADEGGADLVQAAIWSSIEANGLRGRWVSPSRPVSRGAFFAEFEEDPEGARIRAVLHGDRGRCASPWHPAEVDLHHISLLETGNDIRQVDERTVEVPMNPLTGKCFRFQVDDCGDELESGERDEQDDADLPPAHPAFAAHFTDPLYDDAGADFGPFGSDEGFELVWEWAERPKRAAGASVAVLLGCGADELQRWAQPVASDAESGLPGGRGDARSGRGVHAPSTHRAAQPGRPGDGPQRAGVPDCPLRRASRLRPSTRGSRRVDWRMVGDVADSC